MTKDDWKRLWMHFPIGAVAAWATMVNPIIGQAMLWSTFVYEAFNDWRKHDASYKDVLGIVWGFGITGIALMLLFKGTKTSFEWYTIPPF